MGEEVLKKFGKYFLLDRVAQGGMAEIYRARLATTEGPGRFLVIKRVMAGYGTNAEFLEMFRSEIKVTMGFNHPNIVQLYDFGEEQGQPYIAMEFVDGKNVRQFISRFAEQKTQFPVEFAVWVVEQCASGLHYAHSFKDKITGEPLCIVHRDISPQNILISYDGNAKVIDFGIAKASTNAEATRAGVIKGKPSYLSPEQISGEVLDGRSDIFALGIVLWEMLTGRKLFAAPGENEFAVLKLIESCQTYVKPPSTYNPDVPKELDYIVLKCLAKQREKRFANAEEMQRTLHKFLYSFIPDFSPADLSYCAKDLFKNDIVEDRKKLQKLNSKVEQLLAVDIPDLPVVDVASGPHPLQKAEDTTKVSAAGPVPHKDVVLDSMNTKVEIENTHVTEIKTRTGVKYPGPGHASQSSRQQPAPSYNPSSRQSAPKQQVSGGGGGGGLKAILGLVAAGVAVVFIGPTFGISIPGFSGGTTRVAKREVAQSNVQDSNRSANLANGKGVMLRLRIVPQGGTGTRLTINGQSIDPMDPSVRVPLDQPLELAVERNGFQPLRREFVLDARQVAGAEEWDMDVSLVPVRFGYLTIHTTPSASAVVRGLDAQSRSLASDGAPMVLKTPVENEKFPIGTYSVLLQNEILGMEKTVTVVVEEGKSVQLSERLEIKH